MSHVRHALLLLALFAAAVLPARAQVPDTFQNLQVLPEDIGRTELIGMMGGFARALGVRCVHCHVEEERDGELVRDFAADDKPTKRIAREMIRMVASIQERLATLPERADPPVAVQCMTCHRGSVRPRMLQDTLLIAYESGGREALLATYADLRERYYGRASYDFGEVPLVDVGIELLNRGERGDAAAVLAHNVEMNPASDFALRDYARGAVLHAFADLGAHAGTREYRRLYAQYGARAFPARVLNQVGYDLLGLEAAQDAVAVFRLNVEAWPEEWNVHDSLGEGLLAAGDTAAALASYRRSLELNPNNASAAAVIERLRSAPPP